MKYAAKKCIPIMALLFLVFIACLNPFAYLLPIQEGLTKPTWSTTEWNYIQNKNYTGPGNDIFINPVETTLPDCQARCINQAQCKGIVWNSTHDNSQNTTVQAKCSLKTGFSGNTNGDVNSQTYIYRSRN